MPTYTIRVELKNGNAADYVKLNGIMTSAQYSHTITMSATTLTLPEGEFTKSPPDVFEAATVRKDVANKLQGTTWSKPNVKPRIFVSKAAGNRSWVGLK